MSLRTRLILLTALTLAPVSLAHAIQINIDLERGDPDPQNFGNPSSGYAAGAPSVGVWNGVSVLLTNQALPLVDADGSPTGVTVMLDEGGGGGRLADNPSTMGDDQALLDDGWNLDEGLKTVATITISGLADGEYDVYTYVWDPAHVTNRSGIVDVNGVGPVLVEPTNATFSGFSPGETHAVHRVGLSGGADVVIEVMNNDDGFDATSVNGVQVLTVDPSPTRTTSWGNMKGAF